jgi:hypothetical protein
MEPSKINTNRASLGIAFLLFFIPFIAAGLSEGPYVSYHNYVDQNGHFLISYVGLIGVLVSICLIALSISAISKTFKTTLRISNGNNWLKGAIPLNLVLLVFYIGADGSAWFSMMNQYPYIDTVDYNLFRNSFSFFNSDFLQPKHSFIYQNSPFIILLITIIANLALIIRLNWLKGIRFNAWLKSAILINATMLPIYIFLDYNTWLATSSMPAQISTLSYNLWSKNIFLSIHSGSEPCMVIFYPNYPFFAFLSLIILNIFLYIAATRFNELKSRFP